MPYFWVLPSIMKRLPDSYAWENAMHNTWELAMKVCDKPGVNGAFESGGRGDVTRRVRPTCLQPPHVTLSTKMEAG